MSEISDLERQIKSSRRGPAIIGDIGFVANQMKVQIEQPQGFPNPRIGAVQITSNEKVPVISQSQEETMTTSLEDLIDDVDSGKEKMTKYKTIEDYLNHVDEVLEE